MKTFSMKKNDQISVDTSLNSNQESLSNNFYLISEQNTKDMSRNNVDTFTFNNPKELTQNENENVNLFANLTPKFGNEVHKKSFHLDSDSGPFPKLKPKHKYLENLRNIINGPKKGKYGGNYLAKQMKKQSNYILGPDSGLFSKNNSKLTSKNSGNETDDSSFRIKTSFRKANSSKPNKLPHFFSNKKIERLNAFGAKHSNKFVQEKKRNEVIPFKKLQSGKMTNLLTINEYFLNNSKDSDSFGFIGKEKQLQAKELSESFKEKFSNEIMKSFKVLQFCDQSKKENLISAEPNTDLNPKKALPLKKAPRVNIRYKSAHKSSLSKNVNKFKFFQEQTKNSFLKKELHKSPFSPSLYKLDSHKRTTQDPSDLINKLFW
jgi:hypothetical protein